MVPYGPGVKYGGEEGVRCEWVGRDCALEEGVSGHQSSWSASTSAGVASRAVCMHPQARAEVNSQSWGVVVGDEWAGWGELEES